MAKRCDCGCSHMIDYGACDAFEKGANGRCAYCDHGEGCHPGSGAYHNGPLGAIPRSGHPDHWNDVAQKLDQLYQLHCKANRIGAELGDLITAVDELVAAYGRWLG